MHSEEDFATGYGDQTSETLDSESDPNHRWSNKELILFRCLVCDCKDSLIDEHQCLSNSLRSSAAWMEIGKSLQSAGHPLRTVSSLKLRYTKDLTQCALKNFDESELRKRIKNNKYYSTGFQFKNKGYYERLYRRIDKYFLQDPEYIEFQKLNNFLTTDRGSKRKVKDKRVPSLIIHPTNPFAEYFNNDSDNDNEKEQQCNTQNFTNENLCLPFADKAPKVSNVGNKAEHIHVARVPHKPPAKLCERGSYKNAHVKNPFLDDISTDAESQYWFNTATGPQTNICLDNARGGEKYCKKDLTDNFTPKHSEHSQSDEILQRNEKVFGLGERQYGGHEQNCSNVRKSRKAHRAVVDVRNKKIPSTKSVGTQANIPKVPMRAKPSKTNTFNTRPHRASDIPSIETQAPSHNPFLSPTSARSRDNSPSLITTHSTLAIVVGGDEESPAGCVPDHHNLSSKQQQDSIDNYQTRRPLTFTIPVRERQRVFHSPIRERNKIAMNPKDQLENGDNMAMTAAAQLREAPLRMLVPESAPWRSDARKYQAHNKEQGCDFVNESHKTAESTSSKICRNNPFEIQQPGSNSSGIDGIASDCSSKKLNDEPASLEQAIDSIKLEDAAEPPLEEGSSNTTMVTAKSFSSQEFVLAINDEDNALDESCTVFPIKVCWSCGLFYANEKYSDDCSNSSEIPTVAHKDKNIDDKNEEHESKDDKNDVEVTDKK